MGICGIIRVARGKTFFTNDHWFRAQSSSRMCG
jgi:hypothetical protein